MDIYIDEAGRGPLAGPVYVGLVVNNSPSKNMLFSAYKDSKKLSSKQREILFSRLESSSVNRSYGKSGNRYIDRYGIVPAIRRAIIQGIKKIDVNYKSLIENQQIILHIDGNTDFGLSKKFPGLIIHTYIKGDDRIPAISAASIVAKVLRDREMIRLGKKYSGYGFAQHKGYGTQGHRDVLFNLGLTQIHRKTFCTRLINNA